MQLISPDRIFRGNSAWVKALPQIRKLSKRPFLLGRSGATKNIRQQIYKDLEKENLSVYSSYLQFDCCYEDLERIKGIILKNNCDSIIAAGGGKVLNTSGQILFIFRNGKWDLPKGKAETRETIDQTALREVEEETGIKDLQITKPLEITYHIFKRNNKYQIKKTYWFEMFSDYKGDLKPQLSEGITKVKWIDPKKLKKVKKNIYANIEGLL